MAEFDPNSTGVRLRRANDRRIAELTEGQERLKSTVDFLSGRVKVLSTILVGGDEMGGGLRADVQGITTMLEDFKKERLASSSRTNLWLKVIVTITGLASFVLALVVAFHR